MTLSSHQAIGFVYEFRDDEEEAKRRLVYWLKELWQRNQDKIEGLSSYFFAAAVALTLQLLFWAFALASHIS